MKFASEEKVDTRKLFYGVTGLVGAVATIAQAFRLIDADTAANIGDLLKAAGQFIPTAGVTAAAVVLGRQAKVPGMLTPNASPADQIANGVAAWAVQEEQRAADGDKIKQALQDAAGQAPVVGPLAEQVMARVAGGGL